MAAEPRLEHNEILVLSAWTNDAGIFYEPYIEGRTLGYRLTEIETGRVEYIVLTPTDEHEINPENGATADTFVYHITPDHAAEYEGKEPDDFASLTDYGIPVVYVNHFETEPIEDNQDEIDASIEEHDRWLDESDPTEDPKYWTD